MKYWEKIYIVILGSFCLFIFSQMLWGPAPEQPPVLYEEAEKMQKEFSQFKILPETVRILEPSFQAFTKTYFVTELSYSPKDYKEIHDFYIEEAQRNNWVLIKDESIKGGRLKIRGKNWFLKKMWINITIIH